MSNKREIHEEVAIRTVIRGCLCITGLQPLRLGLCHTSFYKKKKKIKKNTYILKYTRNIAINSKALIIANRVAVVVESA